MFLFSEKISLRALEPSDVELLYQWENDPEIWKISQTLTPYSKYTLKQFIESAQEDIFSAKQVRFMINLLHTKQTVGILDIFDIDFINSRAGMGILIDKNYRNQEIGVEAVSLALTYLFETLHLHQVYCNVLNNNSISLKLFEKCGFSIIGIKKDWIKIQSGFEDVILLQQINSTNH
ncbi:MAG: GNAT family N-acetyltransferase [Bacteroidetes bacterium]|nr:GNAT family N-acetyltransferase [Bacteroidota bacterium]MCL2303256.1 GNAT family N-acetyltransferase [Lentimicrobiaceae bacterium]